MKCISCETAINPQWKHAVEINICPFCGKSIMEEQLKNSFSALRLAMEQLSQYSDQLDDWMLSNHNYIKTTSDKLIDYVPKDLLPVEKKISEKPKAETYLVKIKNDQGEEEEVVASKTQSEEQTNAFFRRAEATKNISQDRGEHLKNLVKKIRRGENTNEGVSSEMMEGVDPEAMADYSASLNDGNIMPQSSVSDYDGGDEIPAVVLSMANQGSKSGANANAKDLASLQKMHDKVRESSRNFESGANRGKGGFSRS